MDQKQATCTLVNSTSIDSTEDQVVSPRIISDEHEGPFIKLRIPETDYVYITVDHDGQIHSGSVDVHSRMVNLTTQDTED